MTEQEKHLVKVGFDDQKGQYWGSIIFSPTIKTVWADSIEELRRLIEISTSKEYNIPQAIVPDPCPGRILLNVNPDLHYALECKADAAGQTIDAWAISVLEAALAPNLIVEGLYN